MLCGGRCKDTGIKERETGDGHGSSATRRLAYLVYLVDWKGALEHDEPGTTLEWRPFSGLGEYRFGQQAARAGCTPPYSDGPERRELDRAAKRETRGVFARLASALAPNVRGDAASAERATEKHPALCRRQAEVVEFVGRGAGQMDGMELSRLVASTYPMLTASTINGDEVLDLVALARVYRREVRPWLMAPKGG